MKGIDWLQKSMVLWQPRCLICFHGSIIPSKAQSLSAPGLRLFWCYKLLIWTQNNLSCSNFPSHFRIVKTDGTGFKCPHVSVSPGGPMWAVSQAKCKGECIVQTVRRKPGPPWTWGWSNALMTFPSNHRLGRDGEDVRRPQGTLHISSSSHTPTVTLRTQSVINNSHTNKPSLTYTVFVSGVLSLLHGIVLPYSHIFLKSCYSYQRIAFEFAWLK